MSFELLLVLVAELAPLLVWLLLALVLVLVLVLVPVLPLVAVEEHQH